MGWCTGYRCTFPTSTSVWRPHKSFMVLTSEFHFVGSLPYTTSDASTTSGFLTKPNCLSGSSLPHTRRHTRAPGAFERTFSERSSKTSSSPAEAKRRKEKRFRTGRVEAEEGQRARRRRVIFKSRARRRDETFRENVPNANVRARSLRVCLKATIRWSLIARRRVLSAKLSRCHVRPS
jgi:hypothetical protein